MYWPLEGNPWRLIVLVAWEVVLCLLPSKFCCTSLVGRSFVECCRKRYVLLVHLEECLFYPLLSSFSDELALVLLASVHIYAFFFVLLDHGIPCGS